MYAITIENRGDAKHHATSRGYEFVLGPQGIGANPGDTLLAALGGCIAHYVRQFFREHGIRSDGFGIQAQAESTPDERRLARIEVRIDVRSTPLNAARRAELLAYTDRCKIHNTLKAACPVSVVLEGADADVEPTRASTGVSESADSQ